MGVQGSGKSTIAALIADRIHGTYIDGDRLHSDENVARMAAGIPLTDADREPWLRLIGSRLEGGRGAGIVIVCSALKRRYRDLLRAEAPRTVFVHLHGSRELIQARVEARSHEYMPPSLLASQFATLEPLADDEDGVVVDVSLSPAAIVDRVMDYLTPGTTTTGPSLHD